MIDLAYTPGAACAEGDPRFVAPRYRLGLPRFLAQDGPWRLTVRAISTRRMHVGFDCWYGEKAELLGQDG